MRIACVVPARNEEEYIGATLRSITAQSLRVDPIVVVDDASEDATAEISRSMGALVEAGPTHRFEARMLRICETVNAGLARLPPKLEYVMISGADDVFPIDWCETLVERMHRNPRLVIASGRIEGEKFNPVYPLGTRIVDYRWWRRDHHPPGLYRESYGWETLLVLYARSRGLDARQFEHPVSIAQRPLGSLADWTERGKAMRDCGALPPQVAWRIQELARGGQLKPASDLLKGYLETDVEPQPWARELQSRLLRRGLLRRASL